MSTFPLHWHTSMNAFPKESIPLQAQPLWGQADTVTVSHYVILGRLVTVTSTKASVFSPKKWEVTTVPNSAGLASGLNEIIHRREMHSTHLVNVPLSKQQLCSYLREHAPYVGVSLSGKWEPYFNRHFPTTRLYTKFKPLRFVVHASCGRGRN